MDDDRITIRSLEWCSVKLHSLYYWIVKVVMKVIILGAGIAGITTAYMLIKEGYEVVLLDQCEQAGTATSYANGGQLSYNYSTPIANIGVLKNLPRILLGLDPSFKISLSTDIRFYLWGLKFLRQCLPSNTKHSAGAMKALGEQSKKIMGDIISDTNINFDYRQSSGKLYLYPNGLDAKQIKSANNRAVIWDDNHLNNEVSGLNYSGLNPTALYEEDEDSGDCHKFCSSMINHLQNNSRFTFLPSHKILSFDTKGDVVLSVNTDKGPISADKYVLAAGTGSIDLGEKLQLSLPIYPMKGYSVTVPATQFTPTVSVTDTATKTVYCRLGNRLRIAGFAEFSGFDSTVNQSNINLLLSNAKKILPKAGDYSTILNQWCGLRPATPDSLPIVSRSPYKNLYTNCGHGMLGWTYSAATAEFVTCLIKNKPLFLKESYLSINRF